MFVFLIKECRNFIVQIYHNYKIYKYIARFKKRDCKIVRPISISCISNLQNEGKCYVGPGAWLSLYGKLFIGNNTIIGPRLKVHTANHDYLGAQLPYSSNVVIKDVHIGRNVWIGADVTILPGVTIGDGCVIGANSVVSKDLPELSIAVGNPIRIVKTRDKEDYNKKVLANRFYLDDYFKK